MRERNKQARLLAKWYLEPALVIVVAVAARAVWAMLAFMLLSPIINLPQAAVLGIYAT